MTPFSLTIEWPGGGRAGDVTLLKTERHWESIQGHLASERAHVYERGRREAMVEVRRALEAEHRDTALKVRSLIRSFEEAIPTAFQEMEQALSHMACAMTRKLVADVPFDEQRMRAVVSQALDELANDADLQVRLHPGDMKLLEHETGAEPSDLFQHDGKIEVVPDARITRGGCYIKTPFGDFDATMESKWGRIESLFQAQKDPKEVPL